MTTDVATTDRAVSKRPANTIRTLLEGDAFRAQVAKALPSHLSADRFIRIACTAMTRTPKLAQCDQASFFNALLTLSQFGLEPDGRHAHLIPFENRKRGCTECQLIIDYKGLVKLVMQSGEIASIHADVVRENDVFEFDRGEIKKHSIDFRKPRGEVYAVYAMATNRDGSRKCEVMTRDDVEAIRKRSKAATSGPWVTDWEEMAKKTVFRRLSKWLPLTVEVNDAIAADDDTIDITHSATPTSLDDLADALSNSCDDDVENHEPVNTGVVAQHRRRIKQIVDERGIQADDFTRLCATTGEVYEDMSEAQLVQLMELCGTWSAEGGLV